MGTYTTNYNLFMPSVGETGWGTLVNSNFTTIDSTMKGLSNRITAVENEVNGNLSCTSVTTSGKITGNGGIAGTTGTFSGAVTGTSFNGVPIKQSGNITVTTSSTIFGYIAQGTTSEFEPNCVTLLPPNGCLYSGTVSFINSGNNYCNITTGLSYTAESFAVGTTKTDYTFTNIPMLVVAQRRGGGQLQVYRFTLS